LNVTLPFLQFLPRDAMHSTDYAVEMSVRLSHAGILSKWPNVWWNFSPAGSHTILVRYVNSAVETMCWNTALPRDNARRTVSERSFNVISAVGLILRPTTDKYSKNLHTPY